jgi:hypothetical protein
MMALAWNILGWDMTSSVARAKYSNVRDRELAAQA